MFFKNEAQKARAILEDSLVDLIYSSYDSLVMHGGTAIWRCYGGNRFSRDVDFYANLDPKDESAFQKELHKLLAANDYPIREEKFNNKTNTLHVIVRGYNTTGKLDITFAHAKGEAVEYARIDGSKRIIHALSPENLLNEKINVYVSKFKDGMAEIQDMYDIMVLKDRVNNPSKKTLASLKNMISTVRGKPPKNENELEGLILAGISIPYDRIIETLTRWLDDNAK